MINSDDTTTANTIKVVLDAIIVLCKATYDKRKNENKYIYFLREVWMLSSGQTLPTFSKQKCLRSYLNIK